MSKKRCTKRQLTALKHIFIIYLNTHKGKDFENLKYLCDLLNNLLINNSYNDIENVHNLIIDLCNKYQFKNYIYYDMDYNKFIIL